LKLLTHLAAVTTVALAITVGIESVQAAPAANIRQQRKLQRQNARAAAAAAAAESPTPAQPKITPPTTAPTKIVAGQHQPSAVATEIDRLIDERLAAENVPASPLADDAEFIRRAYLDITGRVPNAAAVNAFLTTTDPTKRARLIDDLLAMPQFGSSFAGIWRRVLVPPDANQNKAPNYAAFEAWMAQRFNQNAPWDQTVRALLMAEGPVTESPQAIFYIANADAKSFPQADILTRTTSQAFMGVQLQCAQCHDHPFNTQWKQSDFWGMAAFFGRVQNTAAGGNGAAGAATIVEKLQQKAGRKGKPTARVNANGSIVIPEESFHNVGTVIPAKFPAGVQPSLGDVPQLRPAFAAWLTAPDNKYFGPCIANRFWEHFMGRGIVNPVDDFNPDNKPSHPELLAMLAQEFVQSGFDIKHLVRCICNSRAYQRSSVPVEGNKGGENTLFARMEIKVLSPEALADSLEVALESRAVMPAGGVAMIRPAAKKGGYPANTPRDHFVNFFNTKEEGAEAGDYSYGIPQALMLMNQVQFNNGAAVVDRLVKTAPLRERVIEQLYLATLSRKPAPEEMKQSLAYVNKQKTPREGYNGLLWTLVNRSEFVLNH
jgi:hypothetical protein